MSAGIPGALSQMVEPLQSSIQESTMSKPSRHSYRLNKYKPIKKPTPIGYTNTAEYRANAIATVYMYHLSMLDENERKQLPGLVREKLKAEMEKQHAAA